MNKLEIMQRLLDMNKALNESNLAEMVRLAGIDQELLDEMSIEDVMNAMNVRVTDMMREVGA